MRGGGRLHACRRGSVTTRQSGEVKSRNQKAAQHSAIHPHACVSESLRKPTRSCGSATKLRPPGRFHWHCSTEGGASVRATRARERIMPAVALRPAAEQLMLRMAMETAEE